MNNARKNSESGNIIWFILLAIVLLASLTVLLTRSADTVEQSGNVERQRIQGSNVLASAKTLDEALKQMSMRGISENEISFDVSFLSGYANPSCTGTACRLFDVAGGGQSYKAPSTDWLDNTQSAQPRYGEWYFPSAVCVAGVGTGGVGCGSDLSTTDEDLLIVLPWVKKKLCIQINNLLGVTNPAGVPSKLSGDAFTAGYPMYTGSFTAEGGEISDAALALSGQKAGCFEGNGIPPAGSYHFYYALIER